MEWSRSKDREPLLVLAEAEWTSFESRKLLCHVSLVAEWMSMESHQSVLLVSLEAEWTSSDHLPHEAENIEVKEVEALY